MVSGLALVLALVLGAASMALGADGDFFKVGRSNLASAVSTLTKRGAGPALSLRVGSGAPLAVNSSTKVANLNADKLDGVDSAGLLRSSIYERSRATTGGGAPDETASAFIGCDLGDTAIGGGFDNMDNGTQLISSRTTISLGSGHIVTWRNNQTEDTVTLVAICADMTP